MYGIEGFNDCLACTSSTATVHTKSRIAQIVDAGNYSEL